jgi:hypothetical protein
VWNLIQTAWIYFFFVKTRGRTLQELDSIFEASNPVKESLKKSHTVEAVSAEDIKGLVV